MENFYITSFAFIFAQNEKSTYLPKDVPFSALVETPGHYQTRARDWR